MKGWILALVAAVGLVATTGTASAEPGAYRGNHGGVSLSAERSRDVVNDRVRAQFGITLEDSDAVELQNAVNEIMEWGVRVATHYDEVSAETGGYRTHPVYREQVIEHWRASQELRIESSNTDRLTELVRVLQSRLTLQSVSFSVSSPLREQVEDELMVEAIAAFKKRAEIVRETLGAESYRLVGLRIENDGVQPAVAPMRAMPSMAESGASPALDPGTSRVTVGVRGTLELN